MRPRLLVVWVLLLGLVGAIVVIDRTDLFGPKSRGAPGQGMFEGRMLLAVPIEDVGAIEVGHAGALHRFERDATGTWFYHVHGADAGPESTHRHQTDPSLAKRIESALAAFGRTQIERRLGPTTSAGEYGVDAPKTVILVYLPNDPKPVTQYVVGDVAPDALSRYVQIVGSPGVVTIPNYQIDNLVALINAVGSQSAAADGSRP